nr:MAG TPA: hypothetical protein [Caudoviricetes sp.]
MSFYLQMNKKDLLFRKRKGCLNNRSLFYSSTSCDAI